MMKGFMGFVRENYSNLINELKRTGYNLEGIEGASQNKEPLTLKERVMRGETVDLSTVSGVEALQVMEWERMREEQANGRMQKIRARQDQYMTMGDARESR